MLQFLSFCNVILIVFAVEPEILEGKREKKIIQRLDLMSKPKEKAQRLRAQEQVPNWETLYGFNPLHRKA